MESWPRQSQGLLTPTSSAVRETHTEPQADGAGGAPSRRKHGIEGVTSGACTACRRQRIKCDGRVPCSQCRSRKDSECIYSPDVYRTKHTPRRSDRAATALGRSDAREDILLGLYDVQMVESVTRWLDGTPSATLALQKGADVDPWVGLAPSAPMGSRDYPLRPSPPSRTSNTASASNTEPGGGGDDTITPQPSCAGSLVEVSSQELSECKVAPSTWTSMTADSYLVRHLVALYFCWEYPIFACLSKELFLKDFDSGRQRYCSLVLVNAMLSLGCQFSSQPSARANANDPFTCGDHFFKESQRLLNLEDDQHKMTTIQALGIMSVREAGRGRDSECWYYARECIRLAVEMGLHEVFKECNDGGKGDEDELTVRCATFWGAFALDQLWSMVTGSLPYGVYVHPLPPKPAMINAVEASFWIHYAGEDAPLQEPHQQRSNICSVFTLFCELSEIIHQSQHILFSPGKLVTSWDILGIYTQYLDWYSEMPEPLRLGHNFTPAILFTHVYYHLAIMLLFRPFINLRIIASGTLPIDICAQAAYAIQRLLKSYSDLHTLERTSSFAPYFVLASSIMHLDIGAIDIANIRDMSTHPDVAATVVKISQKVTDSISQGNASLSAMAIYHPFAQRAKNMLGYLASSWHTSIGINKGPGPESGVGGCLAQAATAMENPLFLPFSMQSRSMVPRGGALVEAGFATLHI